MDHTVLIVDDDADCRAMLKDTFLYEGFRVVSAANGAEALAVARQQRPDMILLDLMMPVMDGYQFRAAQQADPALASIPVLCISGTYNAPRAAAILGAVGCFTKPIDLDALVTTVRRAVVT